MSAYLSIFEARERAVPSGSLADVSDSVVSAEISGSSDEIDCALRYHHSLPLQSAPECIKRACSVMTSYRCLVWQGSQQGVVQGALRDVYVDVIGDPADPSTGFLGKLRNGERISDTGIDQTPSVEEGSPVLVSSPRRDFCRKDRVW